MDGVNELTLSLASYNKFPVPGYNVDVLKGVSSALSYRAHYLGGAGDCTIGREAVVGHAQHRQQLGRDVGGLPGSGVVVWPVPPRIGDRALQATHLPSMPCGPQPTSRQHPPPGKGAQYACLTPANEFSGKSVLNSTSTKLSHCIP